ncbi:hypothetical protein ACL02R_15750 [Streptomyces sp. MS19]|uniref:hypothetical protein n=1 Tax=Streptomyces sp. MS19 TaxID=3385972 RepID=UPI0039A336F2
MTSRTAPRGRIVRGGQGVARTAPQARRNAAASAVVAPSRSRDARAVTAIASWPAPVRSRAIRSRPAGDGTPGAPRTSTRGSSFAAGSPGTANAAAGPAETSRRRG